MSTCSKPVALLLLLTLIASGLAACSTGQPTPGLLADCTPDRHGHSIARLWNEEALDAIRRDFPAPTVHARNLFHLSSAMYDAWTAFDDAGRGWLVQEQHQVADQERAAARAQAISFAAHRLLRHRYQDATGALDTIEALDQLMADLCYDRTYTATSGDTPAAIGNRIAGLTIDATRNDGSNEASGYEAPYESVNEPLKLADPGTTPPLADPNRWQPIDFDNATSQNGIVIAAGPQRYVGPHWGNVTPFAITAWPDPGPPPLLGDPATDAAFKAAAVEVIRASSQLDARLDRRIDLSPSVRGNSSLGTDDGRGHASNPATGATYEANEVLLADWARVVAEYWADGPSSETPPGHWNKIANEVSDHPDAALQLGGRGDVLDRLEWDIRLYFALNGALHDAAIAAWGIKATYDYSRPISMIRHMGGLGQSSDPDAASFHPDGLPLEVGLIELVTSDTAVAGGRHEGHTVDDVVIRSWRTFGGAAPGMPPLGVGWITPTMWMPYQQSTFVTPAFPGYVSGHSAFSRAGAEVLTAITGDPYFPNGLGEHTVAAGELEFERGPTTDITLQWATYRDAADEAGQSRIWGGIHVEADDYPGRVIGAEIGQAAWQLALEVWGDAP